MAEYGLPPSAFTYVGDNPAKDFTAPSAMGWRTVQITRPGGVHNAVGPGVPDLVISSLDELPAEWPCRSEEQTSELQSLMRISYAVFCLKKKKHKQHTNTQSLKTT